MAKMSGRGIHRLPLAEADEAGMDSVEISPGAESSVCKILDYGKYRYEAQKKRAEAKEKTGDD
jgi:translation initiation factor IF-3